MKRSRTKSLVGLMCFVTLLAACTNTGETRSAADIARQRLDNVIVAADGLLEFSDAEWVSESGCEVDDSSVDGTMVSRTISRVAAFQNSEERIAAAQVVKAADKQWRQAGEQLGFYAGATFDRLGYSIDGLEYWLESNLMVSSIVIQVRFPCGG